MKPLQIVIGCESPLVQRGLRSIMTDASDIVVVGEVDAHTDLRRLVEDTAPDVLVLDVEILGCQSMPSDTYLQAVSVPVLIVTASQDEETICAWVQAGVAGYLLLDEPTERIVAAVWGVARGERGWFSQQVTEVLTGRAQRTKVGEMTESEEAVRLTPRERDVLRVLAEGGNNKDIAEILGISCDAVRFHLKNIYSKLGTNKRGQIIVWAIRHEIAGESDEKSSVSTR